MKTEEGNLLSIRVLYLAEKGEFLKILEIASVWLKKCKAMMQTYRKVTKLVSECYIGHKRGNFQIFRN